MPDYSDLGPVTVTHEEGTRCAVFLDCGRSHSYRIDRDCDHAASVPCRAWLYSHRTGLVPVCSYADAVSVAHSAGLDTFEYWHDQADGISVLVTDDSAGSGYATARVERGTWA